MDSSLCDELLQEIFHRLPPPSSSAVCLVSKQWLRLYRSSKTRLRLRLPPHDCTPQSLSSFLSHFHFLSSLSLTSTVPDASSLFSNRVLLSASSSCPNLRHLRLLTGPVSLHPLLSLSISCPLLTSLTIALSRPFNFKWVVLFPSLSHLSVNFTAVAGEFDSNQTIPNSQFGDFDFELQLESLCLSGIRYGDYGLDWLWNSCRKLKKLQLRSCEGMGDDSSLSSFVNCLKGLQEIELRTCRSIVDNVLSKLAQNCDSLKSLLLYDGGSREGLLQFIAQSHCNLQKLDLRLPLDLGNNHLLAVAENFHELRSLRLQSCCLVTGEGLQSIGIAMSNGLEELALINCDVVEKEPGLLTTLGQNLKSLKKLDLSYNEMMVDKELMSMLVSCNDLSDLKLRGCKGLTEFSMVLMAKSCKHLETIDITQCCGIKAEAVESFVLNAPWLKQVYVEEFKVSDVARSQASCKLINDAI